MNTQAILEENWNYGLSFPKVIGTEVIRDDMLDTISEIFTAATPVVFLEGDSGIGVTTTLAQFVKKNDVACFSLFLSPASRLSYDVSYIRVRVAEQLKVFLEGVPYDKGAIDEPDYKALINRTRFKMRGKACYFVIDGLYHIPKEDDSYIEAIMAHVLPIGMDGFRFLISGSQERLGKYLHGVGSKPYQLRRLTKAEGVQFLSDVSLGEQEIDEVCSLCRGIPSRLSTVRRQIKSGVGLPEILSLNPEKHLDFVNIDFACFAGLSERSKILVAVLAFSKQSVGFQEISEVSNESVDSVRELFSKLTFIEVFNDRPFFVSAAHRKSAETRLAELRHSVNDLQIRHLKVSPNSETSLLYLASYLQQTNNNQELVELIDDDHYQSLLESTQSLSQLRGRAEIGGLSARALSHALHTFRFSLQKSMFIDLSKASSSKAEINALVGIGKLSHAMALVEGAITSVTKLVLLAAYASGLKKSGKNVDPFLVEQLSTLAVTVDLDGEEETASQIAEDLLYVDANLASDLLERALQNIDLKRRDLALSRLSIIASQNGEAFSGQTEVEGKIKSKAIQAFTMAFTHYHRNDSAQQLLDFLKKIPDDKKIRLLIDFVAVQHKREGTTDLIDYALTLIIKETAYLPKAKDYADLSAPLRHQEIPNSELQDFVSRFDGQSGLIKNSSVTRDWIRLAVSLAYAEAKYDNLAACNRLLNAYYDISEIANLEIRSECYSRLRYALGDIDENNQFEEKEGIKGIIDSELKAAVDSLLKDTAMQFSSIEPILPIMVEHDLDGAVELAGRLNTDQNRVLAHVELLELLVKGNSTEPKSASFMSVLSKIKYSTSLNDALISCTKILSRRPYDEKWCQTLKKAILRIKDPAVYASCAISIFKCYESSNNPLDDTYVTKAIDVLLEKTHSTPGRDDICFRAAEVLSTRYPEVAENVYSNAIKFRGNPETENRDCQDTFFQCLALVVRAAGGALNKNVLDDSIIPRLAEAVSRLSSLRQQISLYNDLACRAWIADNSLQKIVNEYCRPLLNRVKIKNEFLYRLMLEIAFPSLYLASPQSAIAELRVLDEPNRNSALYNTCQLVRWKLTAYDPDQKEDNGNFAFGADQADTILNLLENMTYDSGIYFTIKMFTEAVSSKKNKHKFTGQQKRELSDRLIKLISVKLPDSNNIQHDGYKICASAFSYTLRETNVSMWQKLIEDARSIPNVADRAFVFIQIARCLPGKELQLKKDTLSEAESSSELIPSLTDKLGRLELYSFACKDLSLADAKKALKKSLQLSHEIYDVEHAASVQKSLINAADQIEPGFADALLELFDDDPARVDAKALAKHNVEVIKAKKTLADATTTTLAVEDEYLPEACWKNLSSLQSNRINAKPFFQMAGLISPKSNLGLQEAYPFLCWYIENTFRKCYSSQESKQHIAPLCEVLLLSTELAFSIVQKKIASTPHAAIGNAVVGLIVKPNSREESLTWIQQWLSRNCVEYVKFCDPYFTAEDVDIVQLIQAANPECVVHVLARASHLKAEGCASSDAFEDSWKEISDQVAPETYVYGIDKREGSELIHDRWLLSKGQGLRIGTSINSIGNKLSEISVMTPDEHACCEVEIDKFLNNQVYVDGLRVKVTRYQF